MKVISFLLLFIVSFTVFAQEEESDLQIKNISIGLRLGNPSGITFKKYFSDHALELNVGSTVGKNGGLSVFLHYLLHNAITSIGETNDIEGFSWYFGAGGQFKGSGNNTDFGIDGVIGLEYRIPEHPVTLFIDVIMNLEIVDDPFDIDLDGGIGGRYTF